MRLIGGILLASLLALGSARADVVDEAWRRGNDAYFRGDYPAAIAAYEQLDRQQIVAGDLYYNLGVAHFRHGNLGPAIWSFERAVAVAPDDEDARFNLNQARKLAERRVRDKIEGAEREATWVRAVTFLTPAVQTVLFLVLYVAAFALLFARRRADEDSRATLGAGAAILGVAALLAGMLLAGRIALDRMAFAVVLPDVTAVKEGADPNYRTNFEVHAGLRVRLLEREQGWVRIRLANGLEGWLRASDVGRL